MGKKILIIDDEPAIRRTLREILEMEKYQVDDVSSGDIGLPMIEKNDYDVVLCDIKMNGISGIELLEKAQLISEVPIIMISGHGTIETAVDSIRKGAYDYISKPPDLNRMLITIKNASEKAHLMSETKRLKKQVSKKWDMIGEAPSILEVKEMIEKVAPTDARVLITGENGTGKELVAHWLHEKSPRFKAPFVEVNCAAIPADLIESQLFGHEKGAFTSAHKARKGDFEKANGGTLFLDEIGDMSLSAQAKVLRALQENKIVKVGGEKMIPVNVRVLAATNKNLKEEISKGKFREDLFHRLSVIPITVPPLRNRKEDIALLIDHFLAHFSNELGVALKRIEPKAITFLQELHWTGNIRELRNVIERLVILCGDIITMKDVEKYVSY